MTNEDLDRILSREEGILPSAGFTGLVMERVRSEATAPQPIPFPWRRALPGLAAGCVAVGLFLVRFAEVVRGAWVVPSPATETLVIARLMHVVLHAGIGPIALGLFLSLAVLKLSMRLTAA